MDMEDITSHVHGVSKHEKAPAQYHVHGPSMVEANPSGSHSIGPKTSLETGADIERISLKPIETTCMDYVLSSKCAAMEGISPTTTTVRNLKKWKREARNKHSEEGTLNHDAPPPRKRKTSADQGQELLDSSIAKKQKQSGEHSNFGIQMAKASAQPRQSP